MNVLHQVRVTLRLFRLRTRRRLMRTQRKRQRAFLAMPVTGTPRFDERSTIDRFRRESGLR